jgi:hypothetical protein
MTGRCASRLGRLGRPVVVFLKRVDSPAAVFLCVRFDIYNSIGQAHRDVQCQCEAAPMTLTAEALRPTARACVHACIRWRVTSQRGVMAD